MLVLFEFGPGVAAVARDVQAAAGAAGGHFPRLPPRLPQTSEDDARIVRIDGDITGAGVSVLGEDLLPRLTAVGRAIDAAFLARAERRAEHRRECDVGVGRMHRHRADLADRLPDVRPGFTGVGGLVDAVADGDVAADVRLAGADVDHVRVRRRHRDRADRRHRLIIENRAEGLATVGRFPNSAGRRGCVIGEWVARHTRDSADPTAGMRSEAAVLHVLEGRRRFPLVGSLCERNACDEKGDGERGKESHDRWIPT